MSRKTSRSSARLMTRGRTDHLDAEGIEDAVLIQFTRS